MMKYLRQGSFLKFVDVNLLSASLGLKINPTALRKAKTLKSFGLSECNRVKLGENGKKTHSVRLAYYHLWSSTSTGDNNVSSKLYHSKISKNREQTVWFSILSCFI